MRPCFYLDSTAPDLSISCCQGRFSTNIFQGAPLSIIQWLVEMYFYKLYRLFSFSYLFIAGAVKEENESSQHPIDDCVNKEKCQLLLEHGHGSNDEGPQG